MMKYSKLKTMFSSLKSNPVYFFTRSWPGVLVFTLTNEVIWTHDLRTPQSRCGNSEVIVTWSNRCTPNWDFEHNFFSTEYLFLLMNVTDTGCWNHREISEYPGAFRVPASNFNRPYWTTQGSNHAQHLQEH